MSMQGDFREFVSQMRSMQPFTAREKLIVFRALNLIICSFDMDIDRVLCGKANCKFLNELGLIDEEL